MFSSFNNQKIPIRFSQKYITQFFLFIFLAILQEFIIICGMNSDYDSIVQALRRSNSTQVKEIEAYIKRLSVDDLNLLTCLQRVLRDQILDRDIKLMGAAYINALFVENSADFTDQLSFNFITQVLSDPAIMVNYKKQLNRALVYILERCSESTAQKYSEFTLNIFKSCIPCDNRQKWQAMQSGYLMLSSMCCAEVSEQVFIKLCMNALQPSFSALCNILTSIMNDPSSVDIFTQMEYALQSWCIIIDYLIYLEQEFSRQCLQHAMKSSMLSKTLQLIYFYASQPNPNIVFAQNLYQRGLIITSNTYVYSQDQIMSINQVKNQAVNLHSKLVFEQLKMYTRYIKGRIDEHQRNSYMGHQIIIFTGNMTQHVINALFLIAMNKQTIQKLECEDYVTGLVVLLRGFIAICPMAIMNTWRSLLHFLVFPLMEIGEAQLVQFEENAPGFVEISQDICQGQKLGMLKTEVAHLMEHVADNWKYITNKQCNIIQYIIGFCVKSIKHQLKLQEMQFNPGEQLQCKPMSIQCAFMCMSVFSYCLTRYPQYFQDLRIILCDAKIINLPPLQKSRIFIFLSYNFLDIFQQAPHGNHLVEMALINTQNSSLTQCSLDFLFNVMQRIYSDKMALNIAERIHIESQPVNLWQLMKKLIDYHYMKMSEEILITFANQCYYRLNLQIERERQNQIKKTQTILNLLNILRFLCQKLKILRSKGIMHEALKQKLGQLFNYLDVLFELKMEQDLLKAINSFLHSCSKQELENQICQQFLLKVMKHHKNIKYSETIYYISINHFIIKADYFNTVVNIYQLLKEGLSFFVNDLTEKAYRGQQKIMISNTMVLLQNLLALHGNQLGENQINDLKEISQKLFPRNQQENSVSDSQNSKKNRLFFDKILMTRALNLQLICHMYKPDKNFVSKLVKFQDLNIYELEVDIMVFLSCMKVQILKEKSIIDISEILNAMVRMIWKFGDNAEKQRDRVRKQNAKQNRRDDVMKIKIKRTLNFEYIYSFIKTPFNNNDPVIKIFGDICQILQANNPPLYTTIYNKMPEEIDRKFTDIIIKYKKLNPKKPVQNEGRKIYTITGVRNVQSLEMIDTDKNQEGEWKRDLKSDDEDQGANPRQRAMQKRIKKQHKNDDDI